jgi:carbamoyltransferase
MVKFRESFRPFAPAILEEMTKDYFDISIPSPYMLIVMPLKETLRENVSETRSAKGFEKLRIKKSEIPAVTHVDYSVRLQTVASSGNPVLRSILMEFYRLTGCPMVINTSFNSSDEPIVCDHEDAYRCFAMSDLDILVLGSSVIAKPGLDLG